MHPDANGFSNEVLLGDGADVATVFAAIAIVAHNEVMTFRNQVNPIFLGMPRILD